MGTTHCWARFPPPSLNQFGHKSCAQQLFFVSFWYGRKVRCLQEDVWVPYRGQLSKSLDMAKWMLCQQAPTPNNKLAMSLTCYLGESLRRGTTLTVAKRTISTSSIRPFFSSRTVRAEATRAPSPDLGTVRPQKRPVGGFRGGYVVPCYKA